MGFNPHTHEGCDISNSSPSALEVVSIHTPTKGVTAKACPCFDATKVSIHTPTKGVTKVTAIDTNRAISFNPHTHEGCDRKHFVSCHNIQVSIHTPTKGVTSTQRIYLSNKSVSIHTPTKGVTHSDLDINVTSAVSIHTPTKGVTTRR